MASPLEKARILGKVERYEAIVAGFGLMCAALCVVCGVFAWSLYRYATGEKIILVPAYISGPLEFTGQTLSEKYLTDLGYLIKTYAWDFSPESARPQFGALLRLYSAETFDRAREEYYRFADDVEKHGWESRFALTGIKADPVKNTLELKGERSLFLKGIPVHGYPKIEKWEVRYIREGGSLFKIFSITQIGEDK